jgi:spermidine/putrescine transport system permease protein
MKWPALSWFLFFVLAPLGIVVAVSLGTRGEYGGFSWGLDFGNYARSFSVIHGQILGASLWLALLTTLSCAVVGVLMAWAMATATESLRYALVCAVALPFLTNLIIRLYAVKLFVGMDGPLQKALTAMGISFDPFAFTQNTALVFYGMLTTYLPFMVLPLYGAFEKFDFNLVEAAEDLGAGPWKILFSVILPNLKTALVSGSLLVFIPALGEFVIPDLLGGAKSMLYGNLITDQFLKSRDWPLGSALSVMLILILLAVVFGLQRFAEKSDER